MGRAWAVGFGLLLAACTPRQSAQDMADDAASDAAVDALADSGIEERISQLETTVEDQASEIAELKRDVANAQSTADDAYSRSSY